MFAACLTHGEQTNHCKMTMVWWENDISILLFYCRGHDQIGSRDRCVSVIHKAVVSRAVSCVADQTEDFRRRGRRRSRDVVLCYPYSSTKDLGEEFRRRGRRR